MNAMPTISPPHREASGRRKRTLVKAIEDAQREAALKETNQVANQPHRRGDRSIMAGSELGRFILLEFTVANAVTEASGLADYQREVYDACQTYGRAKWRWNVTKGIPMPDCLSWAHEASGIAEDKLEEQMARWADCIKASESALKAAGKPAFEASRDLIILDCPVPARLNPPVRRALQSLHGVIYAR